LVEADAQMLNLAAPLQDGQRLWVPFIVIEDGQPQGGTPAVTAPDNSPGLVNINTADQAELESLPGIGPVTAQKIIAYREINGAFATIEDIQLVSGIGPATFDKIKDLITIYGVP
jgi:competence protein ComEA